ncbi:hypothetical protein AAC387_Pa04g2988 [Persea americana]
MEDMGQSVKVPPGFRFHPTEEELLNYYLRKKVSFQKIDLDVIREVDLNKLEPWEIQDMCKIGSTPQSDWYFFSHKDKKYPTGTRTNRATTAGFWKATGRDKIIYTSSKRIGMRKTLVFYTGRAPHGQKSDWIMHEYRLDDHNDSNSPSSNASNSITDRSPQNNGWVVCRVFKKKDNHKTSDSPRSSSTSSNGRMKFSHSSNGNGPLDEILQYMGKACQQENQPDTKSNYNMKSPRPTQEKFMQLPPLKSPSLPDYQRPDQSPTAQTCYTPVYMQDVAHQSAININPIYTAESGISDWATLDQLLASHLNGQGETSKLLACFNDLNASYCSIPDQDHPLLPNLQSHSFSSTQDDDKEMQLWSFPQSSPQ